MKRILVCACLLLALSLSVAPAVRAAETTILTGKVRTTVTRAPIIYFNGIVDAVLVAPGEFVREGQAVFRYTLQEDARRALQREVNNGPGTENVKSQILELKRQLAQAQAQRNKAKSLAASGLGSSQAFGLLEKEVQSIAQRIDLHEDTLSKLEGNFNIRLEELSSYFDTKIREGDKLPEFLYLKSPIDGYVLSIAPGMNPGATVPAGFPPVSIGQMDPMLIQVPVYEAEVSSLKMGNKAKVEIPSLDNKSFDATVTEIAWVSNEMDVSQPSYFNVELTIPNPSLELKPGFKAVVRFNLN